MVYKFFYKNSAGKGVNTHANKSASNNERLLDFATLKLAKELRQPIIRKFEKRKVYSEFKDNIWGTDLADRQLISKFNKEFRFLLWIIGVFSEYASILLWKINRVQALLMHFKRSLTYQDGNQTKYGLTKEMIFTNVLLKMAKR